MDFFRKNGLEDLAQYRIQSRREILSLLRNVSQKKQLVRMIFNEGADTIVTSILEVDAEGVVIDRAPEKLQNERILASENISFETMLDRIRILFFSTQVEPCIYEGQPAYFIDLPTSLIRLQRREHYRVFTPGCQVHIPLQTEHGIDNVVVPMRDLSAGGLGLVDEQMILDNTPGHIYMNCRVVLSDGQTIVSHLEISNSQDIKLANGKHQRRLGCKFHEAPNSMLIAVQRYITKVEREQNAKATGLA
jgi:c-di-GMP-binding flagellar brake protein YcgR